MEFGLAKGIGLYAFQEWQAPLILKNTSATQALPFYRVEDKNLWHQKAYIDIFAPLVM